VTAPDERTVAVVVTVPIVSDAGTDLDRVDASCHFALAAGVVEEAQPGEHFMFDVSFELGGRPHGSTIRVPLEEFARDVVSVKTAPVVVRPVELSESFGTRDGGGANAVRVVHAKYPPRGSACNVECRLVDAISPDPAEPPSPTPQAEDAHHARLMADLYGIGPAGVSS
jgi:hypothetical protein